jgi:hypothetical protein
LPTDSCFSVHNNPVNSRYLAVDSGPDYVARIRRNADRQQVAALLRAQYQKQDQPGQIHSSVSDPMPRGYRSFPPQYLRQLNVIIVEELQAIAKEIYSKQGRDKYLPDC